jgi:hypothetical protein
MMGAAGQGLAAKSGVRKASDVAAQIAYKWSCDVPRIWALDRF